MQYLIQALEIFRADPVNAGAYPTTAAGLAALQPYCKDVNKFNSNLNASLGVNDPEQELPTFANVPATDDWGNALYYRCPGTTGDYDLISYGANGTAGGTGKDADISANADGSLVSQWFEYTPTSAMDLSMTVNLTATAAADMA
jgi:general secretion pathway protein G